MAYVQSHQSLGRHRKTLRMVDLLKCDRHKLIGHLHELFWWGLDNANTQGVVGDVPALTLADAAGWPLKDADRFVRALLECGGQDHAGFLEERPGMGYVLHDWYEYAGQYNDRRQQRKEANRRNQSARRQRLRSDDVSADYETTSPLTNGDSADSQHPSVAKRSVAKRSVADYPPLPPHDVSADALIDGGALAPPEDVAPSCCPDFARTGSEHWAYCQNAPVEVSA
jgi:hypothetical protein